MKKLIIMCLILIFLLTSCQHSNNLIYENIMKKSLAENTDNKNSDNNYLSDINTPELSGTLTIKSFNNLYLLHVIPAFEKAYPNIKVNLEVTQDFKNYSMEIVNNYELYQEKYQKEISADLMGGESKYDIISPPNYFTNAASGYLENLEEFINKESVSDFNLEDYYTNIIDQLRYNGNLYSIPYLFRFDYGFINKNYLNYSEKYTEYSFNNINYKNAYNLFFQLKNDEKIGDNIYLFKDNHANIFNNIEIKSNFDFSINKADFTSNNFKDFLKLHNEMNYRYYPGMIIYDFYNNYPQIIGKKLAISTRYTSTNNGIYREFSQQINSFKKEYPDLIDDLTNRYPQDNDELLKKYPHALSDFIIKSDESGVFINHGIFLSDDEINESNNDLFYLYSKDFTNPLPITDAKNNNCYGTIPETLSIPKNSQNKELAWIFIKFLISDSEKSLANSDPTSSTSLYNLYYPINKKNFQKLYDKNYNFKNISKGTLDKHKEFLESNFEKINIKFLDNSVIISISNNIYDYFYYDIASLGETSQKCQDIAEIYLSE